MKGALCGLAMAAMAASAALAFERPFDEQDELDVAAMFLSVNIACDEGIFTTGYLDYLIALGAGQRGITTDEAVDIVIPRMWFSHRKLLDEGIGERECREFRDSASRITLNR